MAAYARRRGLAVDVGGKVVVTVDESELPALAELQRPWMANGVPAQAVDANGALLDDFVVQAVPRQVHVFNAVACGHQRTGNRQVHC